MKRIGKTTRSWVGLMTGLSMVMAMPWQAMAIKQAPPLTMTAALDPAPPALNRAETLRIKLATTQAYSNLSIAVTLPPEVALVSGDVQWKGALNVGEQRDLTLTVMLKTAGRFTINVDATFDPAESAFAGSRISLNVIAEGRGVVAGMEPFTLMDLKRARTSVDKEGIPGAVEGVEPRTPPIPPPAIPPFLKPAGQPDPAVTPPKPTSLSRDTMTVTVSGTMKYKDASGNEHPMRYAKVKVLNINSGATDEVMGEGYTGGDGSYSIVATGGDVGSGPDIKVRVYTALIYDVANVGPDTTSTWYLQSSEYTDYMAANLSVSLTTGAPVRGSASDDESGRRFSVLDAMLQVAVEAYALRNNTLMPRINVVYPIGGSVSYYNPGEVSLNILRQDALDWDVLFHEYGHFVQDKGSSSQFDNSPGGAHSGGSTIPIHGKNKGVRLAWSEGWATFFGIEAQIEPTQTLLALPGIPNAGDRIYQDTEDITVTADLETIGNTSLTGTGQGYASENSIMAVLYDLCDGAADGSVNGLSKDYVDVTPKQIWNIVNMGDFDNVGKFYNALCAIVGYDINTMLQFTQVFAMNNVGPELQSPAEGYVVSSVVSPEFKWWANGDPTSGYAHDQFALVVAKNNFTSIIGIKDNIQDTHYTFTDAEWAAITAQSDETGLFQWAVVGYNSIDPRMPDASGLGQFISNAQTFQLRAYHIRLTWTTLGADVDLHLSPPGGTDCYYGNRNPDWGVSGDYTDNPSLDRDCITSCTEENITVDRVTAPGTYRVWVHYYSDHDRGPTIAMIELFRYGQLIGAASQYLGDTGDRWNVFDFTIGGAGLVSFGEMYEDVTRGVVGLAPKQEED